MNYFKALAQEVSSWPNVSVHPHRFGGTEFRFGSAEIGQIHPGVVVDIPFPRSDRDALLADARSGELLIRVHAASVNPLDWRVRAGHMKDYIPLPMPFILGWDVSGVVEAVGSGVTKFKKGDEVYARPKTLKKGGILVSIVGPPSVDEAKKYDVRSAFLSAQGGSSLLAELATLVDSGKIKPMVEKVLPLSEARQAHELNETGHARGKIVLKVA
jgi:NADPH:quinone reductase-like Zn-dependent oxidoreductase